MQSKVESILEKIIVTDDPCQLIDELISGQFIEFNKFIHYVLNNIAQTQDQTKIQHLSKVIGRKCFDTRSLGNIDDRVICLDASAENSMKRIFIKMVLAEIGND